MQHLHTETNNKAFSAVSNLEETKSLFEQCISLVDRICKKVYTFIGKGIKYCIKTILNIIGIRYKVDGSIGINYRYMGVSILEIVPIVFMIILLMKSNNKKDRTNQR